MLKVNYRISYRGIIRIVVYDWVVPNHIDNHIKYYSLSYTFLSHFLLTHNWASLRTLEIEYESSWPQTLREGSCTVAQAYTIVFSP
jgi:hypothetical protein